MNPIPILHSHTSPPYSIQGVVAGGIRGVSSAARLLGRGIGFLGHGLGLFWFWTRLTWYVAKAVFFWWLYLVVIWDFTDLLGIPIIQDLKAGLQKGIHSASHLIVKETPAEIQARMEEEEKRVIREWHQAHCRHITRRNGLWNYFCPLCGKKLIDVGDPPMWQI